MIYLKATKKENSVSVEMYQLNRPKLNHAYTTFSLVQTCHPIKNLNPLTKNILNKKPKSTNLQYINLVSKSAFFPKNPKTINYISYKSFVNESIKKFTQNGKILYF